MARTPQEGSSDDMPNKDWQRYLEKMIRRAKRALWNIKRSPGDHEDVALSALRTYLRQQEAGEELPPEDADDIWPLLSRHLNKKIDSYRHKAKNKGNQSIREADLLSEESVDMWKGFFVDKKTGPDDVEKFIEVAMSDLQGMIKDSDELKKIAVMRLQMYTPDEIANFLDISVYAVRRRLARIRELLRKQDRFEEEHVDE